MIRRKASYYGHKSHPSLWACPGFPQCHILSLTLALVLYTPELSTSIDVWERRASFPNREGKKWGSGKYIAFQKSEYRVNFYSVCALASLLKKKKKVSRIRRHLGARIQAYMKWELDFQLLQAVLEKRDIWEKAVYILDSRVMLRGGQKVAVAEALPWAEGCWGSRGQSGPLIPTLL